MGNAIRYAIAVVFVTLFAVLSFFISRFVIINGISSIEEDQARDAMQQIQSYIRFTTKRMEQRMVDWACWDEASAYMKSPSETFLADNFDRDFLRQLDISFAAFFTIDGKLLSCINVDSEKEVSRADKIGAGAKLVGLLNSSKKDFVSGVSLIGREIFVVAAHRIYDGKRSIPTNGVLVMATHLGDPFLKQAKKDIVLDFLLAPAGEEAKEFTILKKNDSTIDVFHSDKDIFNEKKYTIHLTLKRRLATLGREMAGQNFYLMLSLGLTLLLLGFYLLHRNEKKIMKRELDFRENHDALTRLLNKKGMLARLDEISKNRQGETCVVFYLDINRFKFINNSYGHSFGDRLLQKIGERLRKLAITDYCARMSGDHFAVTILRPADKVQAFASTILAHLQRPFTIDGKNVFIKTSIGSACFPEDGKESDPLMRRAEIAMFVAKGLGENRHAPFTREMDQMVMKRARLEIELREAVEKGSLKVFYQPKVDSVHLRVTGLEALVRWQKDDGSWVPPSDFIPLAEEINLVSSIDMFVLRTACRQNRIWLEMGCAVPISVNMSARSILSENFSDQTLGIIKEEGLPEHLIEVEVTETCLMTHLDVAMRNIEAISRQGIHISLDDFGTGYSSLLYLHALPITSLKIDKKFIDDLNKDAKSSNLVKSIVALANGLGIATVAEGVEEIQQLNFLITNNCPTIQGYFFSKPLCASDCQAFLLNQYELINAKMHPPIGD